MPSGIKWTACHGAQQVIRNIHPCSSSADILHLCSSSPYTPVHHVCTYVHQCSSIRLKIFVRLSPHRCSSSANPSLLVLYTAHPFSSCSYTSVHLAHTRQLFHPVFTCVCHVLPFAIHPCSSTTYKPSSPASLRTHFLPAFTALLYYPSYSTTLFIQHTYTVHPCNSSNLVF